MRGRLMGILAWVLVVAGLLQTEATAFVAMPYALYAASLRSAVLPEKSRKKTVSTGNAKKTTQSAKKQQSASAKVSAKKPPAAKPQIAKPQSAKTSAKQLTKLRQDIERDRAKLREMKQKERQVSTKLQQYRQKDERIKGSLQKLNTSLSRVQDSLRNAAQRISTLSANSAILRREYADLVYAASRTESPGTDEMLLGTASVQDVALMEGTMRHLSRLAGQRIEGYAKRRDSLAVAKERLAEKRNEAATLKAQQEAEKNKVQSAIQGKKDELKFVQANKQELIRRLEERNASARKLESMIGSLVSKAEGGGKSSSSYMQKNANKGDDNTAEQASNEARAASLRGGFRRHALPWPTDSRVIVHKFGRYTNPATGTLIENLGVGIGAKSGSAVRAVSGGVVTLVNWLPGYGSLVIIDHGNTFRTVYANLASVSIQQGQNVKAGTVLGRSGRSVDGEYLHFELWHDRDKLNPASWLE